MPLICILGSLLHTRIQRLHPESGCSRTPRFVSIARTVQGDANKQQHCEHGQPHIRFGLGRFGTGRRIGQDKFVSLQIRRRTEDDLTGESSEEVRIYVL